MVNTSYSNARQNLAELLDKTIADREIVIISRRDREDVAMIAASELSSLMETVHLLRSPRNAERLLAAIERAREGLGETVTIAQLRQELLDGETTTSVPTDSRTGPPTRRSR